VTRQRDGVAPIAFAMMFAVMTAGTVPTARGVR
jgi:hypothetical protein